MRGTEITELICIRCPSAKFLDPKRDICYKTGGLYCKKLKVIVGKYDLCRVKARGPSRAKGRAKTGPKKTG
jgi:hypothetical protein